MKTATILPQAFLHLTKDDDYHMALAHLVGKAGFEDYTKFYEEVGKDKDKFLIMDTGLIEGDARPIEELIEKAAQLNADEMALNDVFMDADQTLITSYQALTKVKDSGLKIRTMGIPQGTHLDEWVMCAKEMLRWDIDTLGIPKVLFKLEGFKGRLNALMEIQEQLAQKKVDIHLLGCWETPLELKMIEAAVRQGLIAPVRGVDSAIAYAYAREGIRITDDARPEGAINFAAQECPLDILDFNIKVWKHEAMTLSDDPGNMFYML